MAWTFQNFRPIVTYPQQKPIQSSFLFCYFNEADRQVSQGKWCSSSWNWWLLKQWIDQRDPPPSSIIVTNWVLEIGFSGTRNQPKNGFKASWTRIFFIFLPNSRVLAGHFIKHKHLISEEWFGKTHFSAVPGSTQNAGSITTY